MTESTSGVPSQGQPHENAEDVANGSSAESQLSGVTLPKIIDFNNLSRCGDEVWISYNGTLYRLRSTKQGKLILTK